MLAAPGDSLLERRRAGGRGPARPRGRLRGGAPVRPPLRLATAGRALDPPAPTAATSTAPAPSSTPSTPSFSPIRPTPGPCARSFARRFAAAGDPLPLSQRPLPGRAQQPLRALVRRPRAPGAAAHPRPAPGRRPGTDPRRARHRPRAAGALSPHLRRHGRRRPRPRRLHAETRAPRTFSRRSQPSGAGCQRRRRPARCGSRTSIAFPSPHSIRSRSGSSTPCRRGFCSAGALRWIGTAGDDEAALASGLRQALGAFCLRIPPVRERPHLIAPFVGDTVHAWCSAARRASAPLRRGRDRRARGVPVAGQPARAGEHGVADAARQLRRPGAGGRPPARGRRFCPALRGRRGSPARGGRRRGAGARAGPGAARRADPARDRRADSIHAAAGPGRGRRRRPTRSSDAWWVPWRTRCGTR